MIFMRFDVFWSCVVILYDYDFNVYDFYISNLNLCNFRTKTTVGGGGMCGSHWKYSTANSPRALPLVWYPIFDFGSQIFGIPYFRRFTIFIQRMSLLSNVPMSFLMSDHVRRMIQNITQTPFTLIRRILTLILWNRIALSGALSLLGKGWMTRGRWLIG